MTMDYMDRLRCLSLLLFSTIPLVQAQFPSIQTKSLVNASIDAKGELVITASGNSSSHDFDFLAGRWNLHNKRLKTRLDNCNEWFEFVAEVDNRILLNGLANLDVSRTSYTGTSYETISLRLFNPDTRLWNLYWVDGKTGTMDPPVTGSFDGNIGIFYSKITFNDVPVLVMFKWDKTDPDKPEWSQAYSTDDGKTWEWNSLNVSHKKKEESDLSPVPETFMPKIISTDSLEFNAAFSPDGGSFYFTRSINKQTRIFVSKKVGSSWSAPAPVSFSAAKFSDADPAFSPKGELYFISNRPLHGNDTTKDYDIWKVIPKAVGAVRNQSGSNWSEPINVREFNSGKDEFYISFTKTGSVYFASSREGGYGEEDIYYCENRNNKLGNPQNLGDKINSAHSEYDPFITADGSGLIFASAGRKDSFGKADLYWSARTNGGWAEAKHFDQDINTATRDFCPYITFDLKYFFYSSMGDVKFVTTEQLPEEILFALKK